MANTFTVQRVERGTKQAQGMFHEMWFVTGVVDDQDAINDDVSVTVSLTVPGVALGDMVIGTSFSKALSDANASVTAFAWVDSANTVKLKLTNVDETTDAYDADTLNTGTFKIVVGRPSW